MPFGGLLTSAIIGGVSTITGSVIGGSKAARTSSATPIFTQDQQNLQTATAAQLQNEISNPGVNLDPLQATATGQINQNYNGLEDRLQRSNVDRGFGRSGTTASNEQTAEIARQGDLGSLASRFAGYQLDQENKVTDQAEKFEFADPGTTNVGAGSGIASGLGALSGVLSGITGAGSSSGGGGGLSGLFGGGGGGSSSSSISYDN